MTSQVADASRAGAEANDTVRRTIDAVAKGRGLTRGDVAEGIGMAKSTFHRKMAARGSANPFSAGEVAAIAEFLDVKVAAFYDGLGGTFAARLHPASDPSPEQSDAGQRASALAKLTAQKQSRARGADVTRRYPEAA